LLLQATTIKKCFKDSTKPTGDAGKWSINGFVGRADIFENLNSLNVDQKVVSQCADFVQVNVNGIRCENR